MSLPNLSKIGALAEHTTDVEQVARVLAAVRRSIADARQESISPETRLDAAYRAIVQASMVGLWANGYRTAKSKPGHHATVIQSLTHSIGLEKDQMLVLDTFRVKRNAIDCTGIDADENSVAECIKAADELLQHLINWLTEHRPELLA
ncbi:MAG: DNA-binding protein [Woeseia sp.]